MKGHNHFPGVTLTAKIYTIGTGPDSDADYVDVNDARRQNALSCGPRILTFYLYLSDVEEGGETNFPRLGSGGVAVTPKRGRAVLWPSTMSDNLERQDPRTHHEAKAVSGCTWGILSQLLIIIIIIVIIIIIISDNKLL